MSLATFDSGDLIRLGNHVGTNDDGTTRDPFKNTAGVATDPTAVVLQVKKPSGTTLTYGWPVAGASGILTKEAATTGRFYFDVSLDATGSWFWHLAGTGAVQTAEEGEFYVRQSVFA